jgi:hypothetical protein
MISMPWSGMWSDVLVTFNRTDKLAFPSPRLM